MEAVAQFWGGGEEERWYLENQKLNSTFIKKNRDVDTY